MTKEEAQMVRDAALHEAAEYVRALADGLRSAARDNDTSRMLHNATALNFEDAAAGIERLRLRDK